METIAVTGAPWSRLSPDVAAALRPVLAQTARDVSAEVTASVPAFAAIGPGAKFSRDLDAAVRTGLDRFVDLVGTGQEALTPAVRDLFSGLGAAEARDGRGPEILLSALRISSRLLLRRAVDALAASRPVGTPEVVDLSDAITGFVDEIASACTDGYARQVREDAGEGDRRRRELAGLLLRGGGTWAVIAQASAAIGWPPPGQVTAVLVPASEARAVRFRFSADGVVAEHGEDAVLLLRGTPARAELAEALRGRRAVVAPTLGWQQVPTAVQLAELTDRPALDEAPAFADDHLADLALRGQPAAVAVLSQRRLAGLSGLRPAQRETLLRTLRSWLWHWGSRPEVAAELFVHPQTVSYRVAQLRELLGADLEDPRVRFELLLAVTNEIGGRSVTDLEGHMTAIPKARILLVDDRAENLIALEAILASLGQELVRATSGEAALAALLADEFAVILLDVVMPGMDGFETAAYIKRRARTQDVPIIFLTAAGDDPELVFRGYAAGAVDYISKPFDPSALRSKVAVFVDIHLLKVRQVRAVSELSARLSSVEAAAAGLASRRLDEAVAALRETLDGLRGG